MDIKPYMSVFGFGHRDSRHIVLEKDEELWLAAGPGVGGFVIPGVAAGLPGALRFEPLNSEGEYISYTYTATEALLTATDAAGGVTMFAVDGPLSALRITGSGAIRLNGVETAMFSSSLVTKSGIKITVGAVSYLVVVLHGQYTFDDTWLLREMHSVTPVLEVTPDGGSFEIVMFDLPADTSVPEIINSFDEVCQKNAADFKAFQSELVSLPDEWNDVKEKISYPLWLCHRVLDGKEVIVENKVRTLETNPALLAIASMAFSCAKKAVSLILAKDPSTPLTAAVAAKRLVGENMLNDSRGDIYRIYSAIDRAVSFFIKERTIDRDGLSYYAYRFESGKRTAMPFFSSGGPVVTPDLNTYLTIADDITGRLASMELDDGEGKRRTARAKNRLTRLIYELWDGENFIARNACTEEATEPDDELSLIPILLGKLLPEHIIEKLSQKINADNTASAFGLLLVGGLYDAGETQKAKDLTTAALHKAREEGVSCPFYAASLIALAHKVL